MISYRTPDFKTILKYIVNDNPWVWHVWHYLKSYEKISFIRENIDIKFKLKQTRNLHLNGNLRHIIGMLSSLLVFNWKDWFEKKSKCVWICKSKGRTLYYKFNNKFGLQSILLNRIKNTRICQFLW